MTRELLKYQIEILQKVIYSLRLLHNDGVDLTAAIEQAESRLHELGNQLGWYSVSPINDGQATESVFYGTHEECQKFVSDWRKEYPEDKGGFIITSI